MKKVDHPGKKVISKAKGSSSSYKVIWIQILFLKR